MTHIPLCTVKGCPRPSDPDWHVCFIDGCNKQEGDHQHFPKKSLAGKGAKIVAFLCRRHHELITLNRWREGVYVHHDGSKRYYVQNEKGEEQCERIIEAVPEEQRRRVEAAPTANGAALGGAESSLESVLPVVSARDQLAKASTKGRQALELASSVEEVKNVRDQAEALGTYAKAAHLGLQSQNLMADIKIRAERKAGQLLGDIEREPGKRKGSTSLQAAIRSAGIDSTMAHRWQLEAEIPDLDYEAYAQVCNEESVELTSAGILRLVRALKHQEKEPERCPCGGEYETKRVCRACGKEKT